MEQLYRVARSASFVLGLTLAVTGLVVIALAFGEPSLGRSGMLWVGAVTAAIAAPLLVWPFWPRQGRWILTLELCLFAGFWLWITATSDNFRLLQVPALVFSLLLLIRIGLSFRRPSPR